MIYRLPPLNALRVFETAARHLSFKEAAQELSITQAAVSHQIKSLEEYLGVELFRRAGRGVQLTEAARACLPKLREGFESLAAAVELIRERAAETELMITDRKSTRLNSSHQIISYAVFCLKKKKETLDFEKMNH